MFFSVVPIVIKIAFIAAAPYRAVSFESYAAHISVDSIVAKTESACQFFAAQQFAILHVGALQNVYFVMIVIVFDFLKSETCVFVKHRADHLMEDLEKSGRIKGIFVAACKRFLSGSTPILTVSSIKAIASSFRIYFIICR